MNETHDNAQTQYIENDLRELRAMQHLAAMKLVPWWRRWWHWLVSL
jgi:hypothetical protein